MYAVSMLNVSIIIPAWNEQDRIADCLTNAIRQTVMPHEVIVVDNRSTDDTTGAVERFMEAHPQAPIRLLHQDAEQGLIPTRNFGLNAATGDVLGRIDADCMLKPDWVEVVAGIFTEDAEANSFTFVMFSCVAFFGTAFVNSLNWALVPDTVDYGEWKTGIRAEGSVYTGYTFFRKISAALAGFLPGIMLTQIGYVPNIAQSDATLQGLRQLIFIWPCALAIIAALTMGFFYTLNEKRFALIIEEINQRKNKEMATEEKTASVTL